MDIAKYIGLYLLKNKYCCLQGLGNLEIKKTASKHNGSELTSAVYFAKLDAVGSIDDAFPNFVANNEQVSIARASNEISEFIKQAKTIIANGGAVTIPSVGQYLQKNNQLHFELDAAFSMPNHNIAFPMPEAVKKEVVEETQSVENKPYESYTNYNNYNQQRSINWNIVAFWGVIIIIGGGILAWAIRYVMNQQQNQPPQIETVVTQPQPINTAPVAVIDSNATDTNQVPASPNQNAVDTPEYKFIIKEYNSYAKAEKKEKQLKSYGYNVSIISKDSTVFYVVNTLKVAVTDTTKIKDSLSKLLNPSGVRILK